MNNEEKRTTIKPRLSRSDINEAGYIPVAEVQGASLTDTTHYDWGGGHTSIHFHSLDDMEQSARLFLGQVERLREEEQERNDRLAEQAHDSAEGEKAYEAQKS